MNAAANATGSATGNAARQPAEDSAARATPRPLVAAAHHARPGLLHLPPGLLPGSFAGLFVGAALAWMVAVIGPPAGSALGSGFGSGFGSAFGAVFDAVFTSAGGSARQQADERLFAARSDPARLLGPLSMLVGADAKSPGRRGELPAYQVSSPGVAGQYGTLRYRHRFLSWHVQAPLETDASGRIISGQVVVIEDSDDDMASAIVYRFAADGSIVASAPGGALLGTIDPAAPPFVERLHQAPALRLAVSGR